MRGGATRSARASVAARALVVVAAVGSDAAAQQRPIDPNDRFAARPDEPELDAAIQIDRWLEATAVKLDDGWAWPAVPDDWAGRTVPKDSLDPSLYSGSAGIVLFGIELARATAPEDPDGASFEDSPFAELPRRAAARLRATLPDRVEGEGCGLYTGIAGVGYALHEMCVADVSLEDGRGAGRCVELLRDSAQVAGSGIEWSDCTDVISGGAGIGLFLIHMAECEHDMEARALAVRAGRRLLDLGEREEAGRSWRMTPTFPRVMPNFSHGTAGVAFFLARLYEMTGDRAFLDGALDGARFLLSIADTSNDGCRVFHHSDDDDARDDAEGRALHYFGWCHGPLGTAQTFMKLAQVAGDPDWTDWTRRCANAVRTSGIPVQPTPGFWNNVGLCCGSAGVASFFERLARAQSRRVDRPGGSSPGDPDLEFARRCVAWTLAHGTRDERGLRFPQAEHRMKPELVEAQVGLMQGAAGIGLMLLRFAAPDHEPATLLPDDPALSRRWVTERPSLFPTVPAALPDAVTTRFEELGLGLLFSARSRLQRGSTKIEMARDPPAASIASEEWCAAARAAGATYVLVQTDDVAAKDGKDRIVAFARSAHARGLAVGLSVRLETLLRDHGPNLPEEIDGARLARLLTGYGALALLRIEVPRDGDRWVLCGGADLYRAAKSIAPRIPIEFVATEEFITDEARDASGVQRIGPRGDWRPDPRFNLLVGPRSELLWPTDVVADAGHSVVFPAPSSTLAPECDGDGPWRIVGGRHHYVPLQIEMPLKSTTEPSFGTQADQDLAREVRRATARSRNVLLFVHFEPDGTLSPGAVAQLRELGAR